MELKIKIQVLVELLEFLPLEYLILVELLWGNGIVSPFYIVVWTCSLDGLDMNENIITSLNLRRYLNNFRRTMLHQNTVLPTTAVGLDRNLTSSTWHSGLILTRSFQLNKLFLINRCQSLFFWAGIESVIPKWVKLHNDDEGILTMYLRRV